MLPEIFDHFNEVLLKIESKIEREEFESLRSEMKYYLRKEEERAKMNLIFQNTIMSLMPLILS